jgi:RNA polymerase sigma factor (sigma-70 family)
MLDALIHDYGPLVSSICRRMIRDEETARDAAQEVWLEVTKSFPSFRGETKVSTWLYTLASRVVKNYAQKEHQYSLRFLRNFFHGPEVELSTAPEVDAALWVKEQCDMCLTGILHCLDTDARLIYIFKRLVELPYTEIAAILEQDEQTIRQTYSRARKKLNNFLNDECALYNPQGTCRCRPKSWVTQIELPQAFQKMRQMTHQINLYKEAEAILPRKNFWEKYV